MATLRDMLEEQDRCRNKLGNTVRYPDEQERYLRLQKQINEMAATVPPAPSPP